MASLGTTTAQPPPSLGGRLLHAEEAIAATASALRGHPGADRVAYGLSQAANHSVLWHSLNAADLTIGILGGDPLRRRRAIRRSVVQGIEQAVVNGPLKSLVRRARPAEEHSHPHRLRQPLTSSFPSGHATAGACAAELMGSDLGHRAAWWTLAAAVGWSRVHVGVHHPADVAVGWLVGGFAAHLAQLLWPAPGGSGSPAQ